MPRSIQVGVPSGWFSVTKLIAAPCSGRLNLVWPVVDQITMSTPGVSHPSPTTVEDFRRVLDERAVQPLFQPADRPREPPRPRLRGPGQRPDGVGPGVAGGPVRGRLAGRQGGRAGLGLPGGRL